MTDNNTHLAALHVRPALLLIQFPMYLLLFVQMAGYVC